MEEKERWGANLFLANFFFQATLTPALSHWRGRGRIVGCPLENPAAGLAGRASAQPESSDICSFSQGEKVRMRASLSQKQICARPFTGKNPLLTANGKVGKFF